MNILVVNNRWHQVELICDSLHQLRCELYSEVLTYLMYSLQSFMARLACIH